MRRTGVSAVLTTMPSPPDRQLMRVDKTNCAEADTIAERMTAFPSRRTSTFSTLSRTSALRAGAASSATHLWENSAARSAPAIAPSGVAASTEKYILPP